MTDYDAEYRACESACGEPFREFVEFFESQASPLTVVDLGCGQGRDALVAARCGHSVVGFDCARSGIDQLRARARADGLPVECHEANIEDLELERRFDVVVLDRVLHMLPTPDRRSAMIAAAQGWLNPGGHMLIADTRSNRDLVRDAFREGWEPVLDRADFYFTRRPR